MDLMDSPNRAAQQPPDQPNGRDQGRGDSEVRFEPITVPPTAPERIVATRGESINARAGSVITRQNVNQPLANIKEDEATEGELLGVQAIIDHSWIGNTLYHHVEWEDGDKSWEPLHHINCLPLVVDYHRKNDLHDMARAMEIYTNCQPVNLRLHVKDCWFAFWRKFPRNRKSGVRGILHAPWKKDCFLNRRVGMTDVRKEISKYNFALQDRIRSKIRVIGGAEFEVVNKLDDCIPPMVSGQSIDDALEGYNPVLFPVYPNPNPDAPLQTWQPDERNQGNNPHRIAMHAPTNGPSYHTFIPVLVHRSKFAEWELRPLRTLQPGKKIMRVEGMVVDEKDVSKRMRKDSCEVLSLVQFISLSKGKCLDRNHHFDFSRMLVQSCDANCEIVEEVKGDVHAVFVQAKRIIESGECLSIDYFPHVKAAVGVPHLRADYAECLCGHARCRGIVWMEEEKSVKKGDYKAARVNRSTFNGHNMVSKTWDLED